VAEQTAKKGFVQGWIEAEKKEHPECEVVEAIARFTVKDELNEAKLLVALKAMTKPEVEGET
jgi:hypothetical protein